MNRFVLPLLLLLGVGLAALAATEILAGLQAPPPADRSAATVATASAGPLPDILPGQVSALLARPPFSPDRRPDPAAASGADPRLPHLTGITVSSGDRRAIFAGPNGARSAVLGQGDQIGVYRVQTISPAEVVLTGPDGAHTVRPTFSAAPSPVPIAPPPFVVPVPGALPVQPFPVALPPALAGQGRSP